MFWTTESVHVFEPPLLRRHHRERKYGSTSSFLVSLAVFCLTEAPRRKCKIVKKIHLCRMLGQYFNFYELRTCPKMDYFWTFLERHLSKSNKNVKQVSFLVSFARSIWKSWKLQLFEKTTFCLTTSRPTSVSLQLFGVWTSIYEGGTYVFVKV